MCGCGESFLMAMTSSVMLFGREKSKRNAFARCLCMKRALQPFETPILCRFSQEKGAGTGHGACSYFSSLFSTVDWHNFRSLWQLAKVALLSGSLLSYFLILFANLLAYFPCPALPRLNLARKKFFKRFIETISVLWKFSPARRKYFIFAVIYQNGVKHTPCWPAKEAAGAAGAAAASASKCKFNAACSGKGISHSIFPHLDAGSRWPRWNDII